MTIFLKFQIVSKKIWLRYVFLLKIMIWLEQLRTLVTLWIALWLFLFERWIKEKKSYISSEYETNQNNYWMERVSSD